MYILVITLETFLFGLFSYITCLITYIYNVKHASIIAFLQFNHTILSAARIIFFFQKQSAKDA